MAYNTYFYVIFLSLAVLFYYLIPKEKRWMELLLAGFLYYFISSRQYTLFLLFSIVTVFTAGRIIGRLHENCKAELANCDKTQKKAVKAKYEKYRKWTLAITVAANLGILVFRKYFLFVTYNLDRFLDVIGIKVDIPQVSFILPLGISFYTLQAIGYLIDVNREKYAPETHPGKFALFMSFFPQMVEGPICRYEETAEQLFRGHEFDYRGFTFGVQRICYGMFKKIVIADRLDILVNQVYANYNGYSGILIAVAALAYTIELYADFTGCMDMVLGSAELFGVKLPENFDHPFAARTVQEYWRRWHITLGSWFRDYMFYSVSLSGPVKKLSKKVKSIRNNAVTKLTSTVAALFVVWTFTGIWHGGSFRYLLYGWYYFGLIVLGMLTEPVAVKFTEKFKINRESGGYIFMQKVRTFFLVNIGLAIFRATTISQFVTMSKSMFRGFSLKMLFDGTIFKLGLDQKDFMIVAVGVLVMLIVGMLQVRGVKIRESIAKKSLPIRWCTYYSLVVSTILFGAYGTGYASVAFLYANF